ncbi:MAG: hypothetical protein IKR09_01430 [Alphaproteobacteria bacterium]|nr:hypothetical protein [Alphaproteobacteria bacterium]
MSIFEAGMLLCFGASWPAAVLKTYRTKNVEGKSKIFLMLILAGYICGMINKVLYFGYDIVFWLYVINFMMVLCDLVLYFRYKKD